MFKIRDVAALLNVPTVEIHKKLISLKQDLREHVVQERGITLIDDEGVQIISRSFLREEVLTKDAETSKNKETEFNDEVNREDEQEVYTVEGENEEMDALLLFNGTKLDFDDSFHGLRERALVASEIVEKNDAEIKRSYEINALKSEINRLDTEIYKTKQMMQDYIDQLGQRSEEMELILKERLY